MEKTTVSHQPPLKSNFKLRNFQFILFFKKTIKWVLRPMTNILKEKGFYGAKKYDIRVFKNVLLRKFWRFLDLYPDIRTIHFFYERPNSFMAPKAYEFTQMFKDVKLKKSDVVLDLGCGDGTFLFVIGKSVKKVVGVDINKLCIQDANFKAKELSNIITAEFHCSKLEKAGFEEGSFDKIISLSVIEHIPNYLEVLEEVFKLLKNDGEMIISVDSFSHFDKEKREVHRNNFDVQKYFEKNELYDLLNKIGFKEISIEPIFKSKFSEKWFIRVMNNPGEYFGSFKRIYSFILYYVIVFHEKRIKQQDHGIFLIAKCKKSIK